MKQTLLLILLTIVGSTMSLAQFGAPQNEYWIVIPPVDSAKSEVVNTYICVSAAGETEMIAETHSSAPFTHQITSGTAAVFSNIDGTLPDGLEIETSETVEKKFVHLSSDGPVTVSVLNSAGEIGEGYAALPVSMWGTEYVVSTSSDDRPYSGGFTVVASEPHTLVTLQLSNEGKQSAKTMGGYTGGSVITVVLNMGESYTVMGDGSTTGLFDLTGTRITSDKPVGVIAFHQKTTMPALLVNATDNNTTMEMLLPNNQLGVNHISVQSQREIGPLTNPLGDVYKVTAIESNTRWTMKHYDPVTHLQLGQSGGVLHSAGDFAEISQSVGPTQLPNGITFWNSDKPVSITQFATSSDFDGAAVGHPHMYQVHPEASFRTACTFNLPTIPGIDMYHVRLLIHANTEIPGYQDDLMSITLNGEPLYSHPNATTDLMNSNIAGGWHYVALEMQPSAEHYEVASNGRAHIAGHIQAIGLPMGWAVTGSGEAGRLIGSSPVSVDDDREQVRAHGSLSAHPVPSSGDLTVDYIATSDKSQLILHYLDGRVALDLTDNVNQGSNSIQINTDSLTPGVYLLRLVDGEWSTSTKVIVQ